MRKSPNVGRRAGSGGGKDVDRTIQAIHNKMENERKQHFARMAKELQGHQEVMANLEMQLSAAWQAMLVSQVGQATRQQAAARASNERRDVPVPKSPEKKEAEEKPVVTAVEETPEPEEEATPAPEPESQPEPEHAPAAAVVAAVASEPVKVVEPKQEVAPVLSDWVLEETPNGEVSGHGLTLTKVSEGKGWDCDTLGTHGWTEGVHEWSVRLDNGGNGVGLGICLGSISKEDDGQNGNLSFLINATTGAAYDEAGNKKPVFPVASGGMAAGSVISVRLDLDAKALTFGLNGQWPEEPTFLDLPEDKWFPFFAIGVHKRCISVYRGDVPLPAMPAKGAEAPKAVAAEVLPQQQEEEEHAPGDWVLEATPNGELTNGGLTLTKVSEGKSWDCDTLGSQGWSEGVHEWSVRLDGGGNGVGVGVCLGEISKTDDAHNSNLSFICNCATGAAYDDAGNKSPVFDVSAGGLGVGSIVSVRLDLDNSTLTFGLNGHWPDAPTFPELPEDTWHPFVALGVHGKAVSVFRGDVLPPPPPSADAVEEQSHDEAEYGDWVLEETPNGQLSETGLALMKVSEGKGWDCDTLGTHGWTDGVHEWAVRLDNGGNGVGLGICLGSITKDDDAQNGNLSFLINCTTGAAYDESGSKKPVFVVPAGGMAAGSIVFVKLDLDAKTLSFGLNEKPSEPTFVDLPEDTWHPFFALGSQNKVVSVYRGDVAPPKVEEPAAAAAAAEEDAQHEEHAPGDWVLEETPNGQVSGHGLTLTKVSENKGWDCDTHGSEGWTDGVHEWWVRLDNGGNGVGLGICLGSITKDDDAQNGNLSFLINCTTGAAYDESGSKKPVFAAPKGGMSLGSIVAIRLDLDAKTLSFGLNGKGLDKPTFVDLPEDTWFPFFALGAPNKSISVYRGDVAPPDAPPVEARQATAHQPRRGGAGVGQPRAQLSPRPLLGPDEKDEGVVVPKEKKSVKELAMAHLNAQEAVLGPTSPRKHSPRAADEAAAVIAGSPKPAAAPVALPGGPQQPPAKLGRGRGIGRGVVKKP